jgi:hypothetical protein
MPETPISIRSYGVLTARIDPTNVWGDGSPQRPVLRLPLELQVKSIEGKQQTVDYTLLCLIGTLKARGLETLAGFDVGPLAEHSDSRAHYRSVNLEVPLELTSVRKYEDVRCGADAFLSLSFQGLVWFPREAKFETVSSQGDLQLTVPRSTWVDQVLPKWGLSSVKLVEITFPASSVGDSFRAPYARVEEAERLFANGQYKQVLTSLRLSFEGLAIGLGFENRVKDCFDSLFADSHPDKREKAREALTGLYKFLHLGPHEQSAQPDTGGEPVILRRDARFALTMAHAVFEYITPHD